MEMRLARLSDFEVYKALFESDKANMLYRPIKSDIKPQKDAVDLIGLDDETRKRIEEEMERTPKKFKAVLDNPNLERIYIVEENDVVIGFFQMFLTVKYKWKLAYCGMKCGHKKQDTFTQAVQLLIKQKDVKIVDVCVLYKSCKKRMEDAGFHPTGGGFYRIEANGQE